MNSFSLKKRIILPLIALGTAVFVAGFFFVHHLEEHQKENVVLQEAVSMQSHLQSALNIKAEVMAASLRFIVQDKRLVAALKAGDRKALLAIGMPIYQRLHEQNNITHFYFHDAQRINLLRVHKPKKYGDNINRFTALGAENSGALFSGIELGPLGTFTLRTVLPVFDAGQLIGYMELGQEIDGIIQETRDMFHAELIMFIGKQYLNQSAWEDGMRMLGRSFDWNMLSGSVVVSQSLPDIPVAVLNGMAGTGEDAGIHLGPDIELHGLAYWAGIIPILDAGDRPVATLVVLHDMTKTIGEAKDEMLTFTGISASLGLIILFLLNFVLGRAEKELADSSEALKNMVIKFETMFATSSDAIMMLDAKGFFDCNKATLELFDCPSREDFIDKHPSQLSPPQQPGGEDSMELANEHITKAFKTGSHRFDWLHCQLDGTTFPAEVLLTAMQLEGRPVLQASVRDISERKAAEQAIEQALNIQRVLDTILNISLPPLTLKEVLSQSLDIVLSIPAFSLLNKGAIFVVVEGERTLAMAAQRNLPDALLQSCALLPFGKCLCGKAAQTREIVFFNHVSEEHEISYDGIQPHGHYCIPIMLGARLLGVLNAYVKAGHVSDDHEKKFLKTVADTLAVVIERKQNEEALQKLAHNDTLTGLPNRTLFHDRLEQSLALAQRNKQEFALLFLDLDHFKEVNDTLGHDMGDLLLKEAATRLQGCVRKMDTVARMGGDEFTLILTETKVPENVELVARKILQSLSAPFDLNGTSSKVGCSIGIAIYPAHGKDGETLLKHADVAMYNAKRKRNSFSFFSEKMRGDS